MPIVDSSRAVSGARRRRADRLASRRGRGLFGALVLGASGAISASAFALQETTTAESEVAVEAAPERVRVGPVNVYTYSPESDAVRVDAATVDMAAVLEDLGPDARSWYQHVMTLSNPWMQGRSPGSEGIERAAAYLRFWMEEIGLEPAFPAAGDDTDDAVTDEATWTSWFQPLELNARRFGLDREEPVATVNVGGVLRGHGALADQWIVIGAHYDHVGTGNYGSRGRFRGQVHPGADDNASGTSGLLVLAERLVRFYEGAGEDTDLRSVLFIAFTAEESGLNGSRHYVRNATIDGDRIDLMMNMDMIGRLRGGTLLVGGVGTAEGLLDRLRPMLEASGLSIDADPSGRSPSDHANFVAAGIPALFFFTGVHDDYHRPGDEAWRVNPRGAIRVIDLVETIALGRAVDPEQLVPAAMRDAGGGR